MLFFVVASCEMITVYKYVVYWKNIMFLWGGSDGVDHVAREVLQHGVANRGSQLVQRWVSPRHYTVDPILLPPGNPIECHEKILPWHPLFPLKRFDGMLKV